MEPETRQISHILVFLLSVISIFTSLLLLYHKDLGFMRIVQSTEMIGGSNFSLTITEKNIERYICQGAQNEIKRILANKQILANIPIKEGKIHIIPFEANEINNIKLQLSGLTNWNLRSDEEKVWLEPKLILINQEKSRLLKSAKNTLQLRLDPQGVGTATVHLSGDKIFVEAPKGNANYIKELITEMGSISLKLDEEILNIAITKAYLVPEGNKVNIIVELQDQDALNDFIASKTGKNMAIRLNINHEKTKILCAPVLMTDYFPGPITIQGLSTEEAIYINKLLQSGALPVALEIIEERNVGTSLGQDILNAGLNKALLAICAIFLMIFMLYGFIQGAIINLTLIVNLALLILFFGMFKITITLSAIAGAVTTLAMAVNANILIMERLLEIQKAGTSFKEAVAEAYEGALTAIIDGSLTTLIAGIIMYIFGMNFVKGYALTLIAGLCISFFTAVTCSQALFEKLAEEKK